MIDSSDPSSYRLLSSKNEIVDRKAELDPRGFKTFSLFTKRYEVTDVKPKVKLYDRELAEKLPTFKSRHRSLFVTIDPSEVKFASGGVSTALVHDRETKRLRFLPTSGPMSNELEYSTLHNDSLFSATLTTFPKVKASLHDSNDGPKNKRTCSKKVPIPRQVKPEKKVSPYQGTRICLKRDDLVTFIKPQM
jgi:hypothetical protein